MGVYRTIFDPCPHACSLLKFAFQKVCQKLIKKTQQTKNPVSSLMTFSLVSLINAKLLNPSATGASVTSAFSVQADLNL